MPLLALHRRFVLGNDKMATAPDLSLRGAKRRGALSAKREEVPLGCREGICSPYKPSPNEHAAKFDCSGGQ